MEPHRRVFVKLSTLSSSKHPSNKQKRPSTDVRFFFSCIKMKNMVK